MPRKQLEEMQGDRATSGQGHGPVLTGSYPGGRGSGEACLPRGVGGAPQAAGSGRPRPSPVQTHSFQYKKPFSRFQLLRFTRDQQELGVGGGGEGGGMTCRCYHGCA